MSDDEFCFDPDQPSGWSDNDFRHFVSSHKWQFARTMPYNPHEYTLRRNALGATFDAAVRYIREHGCIEYYRGEPYKTLYLEDHKYWTMGDPLPETDLINRKPRFADVPQRLNSGQHEDEMTTPPLLAFLADRFVTQRENLATEALAYILGRSNTARLAALQTFRRLGAAVPESLAFRTQAWGPDQVIPDLVGEDERQIQHLIIEAKFWAGLTESQPVDYLRRVQQQGSGTLCFIVPAQRAELLWNELVRRCSSAGIDIANTSVSGSQSRFAVLKTGGSLCLLSWNSLLANVLSEVEGAGERLVASDVRQLQGLCERQDAEAFLPLTSEELTGKTAQRVSQFLDLIDDLTDHLVSKGIADIKGLKATSSRGWYGRYMLIHGVGCALLFSAENWRRVDFTPLWLSVYGPPVRDAKGNVSWPPDPRVRQHLLQRAATKNVRSVPTEEGTEVPLLLPTRVEREHVFHAALETVLAVSEWLREMNLAPRLP